MPGQSNCDDVVERCRTQAEHDFRSGKYHCAEAVLDAIRTNFAPHVPGSVIQMVSGLGKGSWDGCICGSVSGGTIAIGMVLPKDKERVIALTKELHRWFRDTYGATCCRVLLARNNGECHISPGEAAGKIAEMLLSSGDAYT